MAKGIVLLSGGLDSAVVTAMALADGYEPLALTVDYGQRHRYEMRSAERIATRLGIPHRVVTVALGEFGGSALTADMAVPKDSLPGKSDIPSTYVPARNTVLLALALACAEVSGASDLFIGVNAVDYSGYPDCRPAFVEAFERMANVATKAGVEGQTFRVHAPLIAMSKADIVRRALDLGVDVAATHSCYDPDPDGLACGHCDACLIRRRAFDEVGVSDPALKHLAER